MKVKVQKIDGKASGDIELNDDVFGVEPRADILHRVVTWQLENRRGTARPTRERSDVARTGKKWGRQKGGGTARHGDCVPILPCRDRSAQHLGCRRRSLLGRT